MSALPDQSRTRLTDVQTLRANARKHIEDGAVTKNYANREKVIELLNEALATELVCVLRYRHDYFMARGLESKIAADEFLEHANEELAHADRIAERIVLLGGEPRFEPDGLTSRSHSEYRTGKTLEEAIRENLVAERIAIESYAR
jgi:bacterioferritin